jgi:Fe-S oxidoreductase
LLLVEEGSVPRTLQDAFSAVQRTGNSLGKPSRQRPKWTKKLSFGIKDARKEPVDILWFVGDYASYDPRVEHITVKVAEILHAESISASSSNRSKTAAMMSGGRARKAFSRCWPSQISRRSMPAIIAAS